MTSVHNKQVGAGLTAKDLAILGGAKVGTEKLYGFASSRISMLPNNATYLSGAIKVGAGMFIALNSSNKQVKFACAGMVLDGVEDVLDNASSKVEKKVNMIDVNSMVV